MLMFHNKKLNNTISISYWVSKNRLLTLCYVERNILKTRLLLEVELVQHYCEITLQSGKCWFRKKSPTFGR